MLQPVVEGLPGVAASGGPERERARSTAWSACILPMIRSLARLTLLVVLPLALISCATGTLVPERESMNAARASLLPEYRIFYDSLIDYGDWVLIEPFGYVFRPHVNAVAWQPYEDGFWAPTDVYGWTWISSEAFGWATY